MRALAIATVLWLVSAVGLAAPVPPGPDDELHVVALYEGNTKTGDMIHGDRASVKVDRPGKNVTLVVSGSHSITWDITLTPKTNVKQVILCGNKKQAANAPGGVEVINYFQEGRGMLDHASFDYNFDSGRFRHAVKDLFKLTEREITGFQGQYRFDPKKPIVVDSVQKDERLLSDFPKVEPAKNLPKFKFQAVRCVPVPMGATYSVTDFTGVGPDVDSMIPIPKRIERLTFDPANKKYYGLGGHAVHEVDVENNKSKAMDLGMGVPELSHPCGITFDTKRERVVVVTLGGVGHMYTYTPKTGVWAVPAELDNLDLAAIAYHASDDTLYGLASDIRDRGKNILVRYNAKGAAIGRVVLDAPFFPGILGHSIDTHVQMLSTGDHIAILVQAGVAPFGGGGRQRAESFLFLFDPKTEKVKLAWKESR